MRFLRFSLTVLSDANCDDGIRRSMFVGKDCSSDAALQTCWPAREERWTVCTRLNIALDSLHGVREAGRSPLVRAGSSCKQPGNVSNNVVLDRCADIPSTRL